MLTDRRGPRFLAPVSEWSVIAFITTFGFVCPELAVGDGGCRCDRCQALQQMLLCEALGKPAAPRWHSRCFRLYWHVAFSLLNVSKTVPTDTTKKESSGSAAVSLRFLCSVHVLVGVRFRSAGLGCRGRRRGPAGIPGVTSSGPSVVLGACDGALASGRIRQAQSSSLQEPICPLLVGTRGTGHGPSCHVLRSSSLTLPFGGW